MLAECTQWLWAFSGHYLSASAIMWASTHNSTLYEKMSAVVKALEECQNKMGTGYLSAFPSDEFDLLEALQYVWAPYYTIHKVYPQMFIKRKKEIKKLYIIILKS